MYSKKLEQLSDEELKARLHFYRCNNIWDDNQVDALDELQSRQIRSALAARFQIMDKRRKRSGHQHAIQDAQKIREGKRNQETGENSYRCATVYQNHTRQAQETSQA